MHLGITSHTLQKTACQTIAGTARKSCPLREQSLHTVRLVNMSLQNTKYQRKSNGRDDMGGQWRARRSHHFCEEFTGSFCVWCFCRFVRFVVSAFKSEKTPANNSIFILFAFAVLARQCKKKKSLVDLALMSFPSMSCMPSKQLIRCPSYPLADLSHQASLRRLRWHVPSPSGRKRQEANPLRGKKTSFQELRKHGLRHRKTPQTKIFIVT